MHRSTLEILACPSCRRSWRATTWHEDGPSIEQGYLECPGCGIVVPVIDGFALFTEPLLHAGLAGASQLAERGQALFVTADEFAVAGNVRRARGVAESYAAFHPFNEAARAGEPLIPWIEPQLRPGDTIVDLWCRTGWSAEWLAGRFPQQQVIALWEGNRSVLGYRGFRHLLGSGQRAANLDIVFAHPEQPLPFRDGSFALVYAHDALHRHRLLPFAAEALRVAGSEAALMFPHLHLTNSVPDPFFERGCTQLHGRDYRAWLDRVTADGRRRGYVFGESALFDGPATAALADAPDTGDYNGLVLLLPAGKDTAPAVPTSADVLANRRYVVSPLFGFDLGRGRARVASMLFDGAVGELLSRHPVYRARLPALPVALDDTALLSLMFAASGAAHAEICAALPGADAALRELSAAEILRPADVSLAAHRLQRFHALQGAAMAPRLREPVADDDQVLLTLADGQPLTAGEIEALRGALRSVVRTRALRTGAGLALAANDHPLLPIVAMLAAADGFDVRLLKTNDAPTPGTALFLHGDGRPAAHGIRSLPLGLDGAPNSLLGASDSSVADEPPRDAAAGREHGGWIELPVTGGYARCRLAMLVDAVDALALQIDGSLRVLDGRRSVADVLETLCALCRIGAA
ncbi:MAG: Trm112 family protein [Panacagrimonas sp.]